MRENRRKKLIHRLMAVGLSLSLITQSVEGFTYVSYASEILTENQEESADEQEIVTQADSETTESIENNTTEIPYESKTQVVLTVDDYSTDAVELSWSVENVQESDCYRIYRDGRLIDSTNELHYTDNDVTESKEKGDTYKYVVKVLGEDGTEKVCSNEVETYVADDLTIDSYLQMTKDLVVKNLYCDATLYLEGHNLIVTESAYINSSSVVMSYSNDYVFVGGDFNWKTKSQGSFYNGVLEIQGNFTDNLECETEKTFRTSDKHTTIFSGIKPQTIKLNDESMFANVEFRNTSKEGIISDGVINAENIKRNDTNINCGIEGGEYGWTLTENQVYEGDLYLISDELNLNGHKLEVKGDIIQIGGDMNINGGSLVVDGDYAIANRENETEPYEYLKSNGKLIMTDDADSVYIKGDFIYASVSSSSKYITNGKITVEGDIVQRSDLEKQNFVTSGTNTVVLTAGNTHNIDFEEEKSSYYNSEIANLIIEDNAEVNILNSLTVTNSLEDRSNKTKGILNVTKTTNISGGYFSGDVQIDRANILPLELETGGTLYIKGDYQEFEAKDLQSIKAKSICLQSGKLHLGSETFSVEEDFTVNGGNLYIERGKLNIGQNFVVSGNGVVDMSDGEAYISVKGNTTWESEADSIMSAGTIELYGDFTQKSDDNANIECISNHKVILNGTEKQNVSFGDDVSYFNILEVNNTSTEGVVSDTKINARQITGNIEKLTFGESGISGWTLNEDTTIDSDLIMSFGELDLNGYTLHVKGDFVQQGGNVNVNGGKLTVDGDYAISIRKPDGESYKYVKSNGTLSMNNSSDYVLVKGNFICASGNMNDKNLSEGTLEIKGDIVAKNNGSDGSFIATKNNYLLLSGDKKQSISFNKSASDKARIANLEIINSSGEGVVFNDLVTVTGNIISHSNKVEGTIDIVSTTTFQEDVYRGDINVGDSYKFLTLKNIEGTLYIKNITDLTQDVNISKVEMSDGGLYLNGYEMNVSEDFVMSGGNLYLKKGKLAVAGNMEISETAYIGMQYEEDCILVKNNIVWASETESSMTNGILEVMGNFDVNANSLKASGNHKIIFSGLSEQIVSFKEYGSFFNIVDIKNESEQGVVCSDGIPCKTLYLNENNYVSDKQGAWGWQLTSDEAIEGDLILISNTLDLNGHTLTVNGNLIQEAGDITINNGKLIVNGDYRIQRSLSNGEYVGSIGNLIMTNENDAVVVKGDFYMGSVNSHEESLINGKMSVSGNVSQITYDNENNFNSTGSFELVLDGTEKQTIVCESPNSVIANLSVENASESGVVIENPVMISGTVNDNNNKVEGSIIIDSNTNIVNNSFMGSIQINKSMQISTALKVGGSFYINAYVSMGAEIETQDLIINNYFSINDQRVNVHGNLLVNNNGHLSMYNEEGYICVEGDVVWKGGRYSYNYLQAGNIEIKGNLTVRKSNYTFLRAAKDMGDNGTKVLLTGDDLQTVTFKDKINGFSVIDIRNESEAGVLFKSSSINANKVITNGNRVRTKGSGIEGWKLEEDIVIDEDLYIVAGELDLNGHSLTINGNLNIGSGDVVVNGGKLIVNGNLGIQSVATTKIGQSYDAGYGNLVMQYEEDYVFVEKDFISQRAGSYTDNLSNGILEIKGDIMSKHSWSVYDLYYISTTANHETILSGDSKQTLQGGSFAKLTVRNTSGEGVIPTNQFSVNTEYSDPDRKMGSDNYIEVKNWNIFKDGYYSGKVYVSGSSECKLESDINIGGDLDISDVAVDLNGYNLSAQNIEFRGDSEAIFVNKGSLIARGDLEIGNSGFLKMNNSQDYVLVEGNFAYGSHYNLTENYMTAGTLEIKGDFYQKGESSYYKIIAKDEHITIFSGKDKVQNIKFDNPSVSSFNKVIFTKPLETGYTFTPNSLTQICNSYEVKTGDITALEKVKNLEAKSIEASTVTLKWDKVSGDSVLGYEIYRDGKKCAMVSGNTYTDIELNPDTEYTYKIYAIDYLRNSSEASDDLTIHTAIDREGPTIPTSFGIKTKTGSSITLSWDKSVDNCRVKGYEIYRNNELLAVIEDVDSYKDNNLLEGETYKYKIRAFDESGNYSKFSAEKSGFPEGPSIQRIVPSDGGTIGGKSVSLTVYYKNVGNSEGNKVQFEYLEDEEEQEWKKINTYTLGQKLYTSYMLYSTCSWNIKALKNESVKIRCTVYDSDNNFDTKIISCSVDKTAPKKPEYILGQSEDGTIELSWLSSDSEDCSGYKLYKKDNTGKYLLLADISGKNNVDYTDNDVTTNSTYTYKVSAVDKYGNESECCSPVSVIAEQDKKVPEIVNISINNKKISGTVDVKVTAVDNIGVKSVTLQYQNPNTKKIYDIATTSKITDNVAKFSVDTTKYKDGIVLFAAKATDVNENVSIVDFNDESSLAIANTLVDNTGIEKVIISSAVGYDNYVSIGWDEVADKDVGYFQIEQLVDGEYVGVSKIKASNEGMATGLNPNTLYTFRVVGYDNMGNRGIPSDDIVISTCEDTTEPDILEVTPADGFYNEIINIEVEAEDNAGVEKLKLEYSYDEKEWNDIAEIYANEIKTKYTFKYKLDVSKFKEGNIYIRYIVSDMANNESNYNGNPITGVYYIDYTKPDTVEELSAEGKNGYVALAWKHAEEGRMKYDVYRSEISSGAFSFIGSTKETNYNDSTCKYGISYTYKIVAVDYAGNESVYSSEVMSQCSKDGEAPKISAVSPKKATRVSESITLSAVVSDNVGIKKVTFDYKASDSQEDIWINIGSVEKDFDIKYPEIKWNVSDMESKQYNVRVVAYDLEGNVSEAYETNYIVDNTAPNKSVLSISAIGYGAKLSWTKCNDEDFEKYEIYRQKNGEDTFTFVASSLITSYIDLGLDKEVEYSYKIVTVDKAGNRTESDVQKVIPTDEDIMKPMAVTSDVITVREGSEVSLDGSMSSDNVGITSYDWDMGNGDTVSGEKTSYTYEDEGTYTSTLVVKDESGNEDEKSFTVKVRDRSSAQINIQVLNSSKTATVSYAYINIDSGANDEGDLYYADANGKQSLVLEPGTYDISVFKEGYVAKKQTVTVKAGDEKSVTITLKEGSVVQGSITTERLTPEEMNELGVDLEDENNWYVYTVTRKVIEGDGRIVEKNTGAHGSGGVYCHDDSGTRIVYYTEERKYLKNMYELELTVMNVSKSTDGFVIKDCSASLNLQEGLSLLGISGQQSMTNGLSDISGGQCAFTTWYIKADEPGEYDDINVDFYGVLMPFNVEISQNIKADTLDVADENDNTFTDDGFVDEDTAVDYSIYVSNGKDNSSVQGAVVTLEAADGKACTAITNDSGKASLVVNEEDDRIFKLSVTKDEYISYNNYSYTVDTSEYSDNITIFKEGEYADSDNPYNDDEYKIKLLSAYLNGKDVFSEAGITINCLKDDIQEFTFEFSDNIEEYTLHSGSRVIKTSYASGKKINITVKGDEFKKGEILKLSVKGKVDGNEEQEVYELNNIKVQKSVLHSVQIIGMGKTTDILHEIKGISQYFGYTKVTIEAKFENDASVLFCELVQDGEVLATSNDGKFILEIRQFQVGKPVYFKSYGTDKKCISTDLLHLEVAADPVKKIPGSITFGGKGGKITIPKSVPVIGGTVLDIGILDSAIPVSIECAEEYFIVKIDKEFGVDPYSNKDIVSLKLKGEIRGDYIEKFANGSLEVELSMNLSKELPVNEFVIPCVLEIQGGIGATAKATLSITDDISFGPVILGGYGSLGVGFGPGFVDMASLKLYGEAKAGFTGELSMTYGPSMQTIYVEGRAGLSAQYMGKEYKYQLIEAKVTYDCFTQEVSFYSSAAKSANSNMNLSGVSSLYSLLSDESNYEEIGREYLEDRSEWNGKGIVSDDGITTLQTSVYTDSTPEIIACKDVVMMVYKDDDASRTSANRSILVYSIYDKSQGSWSTPKPIMDDGTADYEFDVFTNDEEIYIVWQNAEQSLDDKKGLSEISKCIGISTAKYSTEDDGFISLGNIDSTFRDDKCQSAPNIMINDGQVFVSWYENSGDDVFGITGTNILYSAQLSDSGFAVSKIGEIAATILSMDSGIINNGAYISYSIDTDRNFETYEDAELYIVDISEESKELVKIISGNANNVIFGKYRGENILSWYSNGNINYISSANTDINKMLDEDVLQSSNYAYISDGKNSSILYANTADSMAQAYMINYDSDIEKWGNVIQITNQDKYIEDLSGVYVDGNLILAFNQTKANISHNYINDSMDINVVKNICYMNVEQTDNLIIESVLYDQNVIPGGNVEATVNVTNNGISAVNNVKIVVLDSNGKQVGVINSDETILSGNTGSYKVKFKMQYTLALQDYRFYVYNEDELCDSCTETFGYADLSVSSRIFAYDGDYSLQADITNLGVEKTSGSVVFYNYYDESQVYYTEEFDELAYGEEISIKYNVPDELVSNGKECVVAIKVISDKEQKNTDNDVRVVTVSKGTEKAPCIVEFDEGLKTDIVKRYTNSEGKITNYPVPSERKGYTFDGWYDGNKKVGANTIFEKDTVLTAKWIKNSQSNNGGNTNTKPSKDAVTSNNLPKVGLKITVGKLNYIITNSTNSKKTVKVVGAKNKKIKKVKIPNTIKVNGYSYKVTEIGSNAFAKYSKLKSVTIGNNVAQIGKKAFYNCKNLKKITVKTTKLKKLGKKAFGKINSKAVVKVPKKKYKPYKKVFKKLKVKK